MQSWHGGRLTDRQAALIDEWLPNARLRADMSWNLVDTVVLDADSAYGRIVIKAGGADNHHIDREIDAYLSSTDCLSASGHAPKLLHHDRTARILALQFLPGILVEGSGAEFSIGTHRQAGRLARALHGQASRTDPAWDTNAVSKSLHWLAKPHRIARSTTAELQVILTRHQPGPAVVVPTHGDWQPRNWLIDEHTVRVIDFGRFAWRPAVSDFCRLAAQQWRQDPRLETAFLDGYGGDPRRPDQWRMFTLHEAIGTAVWAHQVGDEPFEAQGHHMLAEALARF